MNSTTEHISNHETGRGRRTPVTLPVAMLLLLLGDGNAWGDSPRVSTVNQSARTIVIIGASYAKSWDIEKIGNLQVVNRGVGGDETRLMLARFDRDVVQNRPSSVLIWGFINDIFRSPRDRMTETQARIRANVDSMVNRARAAGITPVLATEVLVTSPDRMVDRLRGWYGRLRGKQSYQQFVNDQVREVNTWMREYARTKKIQVLDFEKALAGEGGERQRRYAAEDGSHFSKDGYSALTAYLTTQNLK